jgi:hypothetical protein
MKEWCVRGDRGASGEVEKMWRRGEVFTPECRNNDLNELI